MLLDDAIKLIYNEYLPEKISNWIDLGCGSGLFTSALANIVSEGSVIYALDKNIGKLTVSPNPNQIEIIPLKGDFEKDALNVTGLDGILMANSLHYIKNKPPFIERISECVLNNGSFLIVEYDTAIANPWVPYPIAYDNLARLFESAGFSSATKLNEIPSVFGKAKIYSSLFRRK